MYRHWIAFHISAMQGACTVVTSTSTVLTSTSTRTLSMSTSTSTSTEYYISAIFTEYLKFIEVKVSHIPSHFSLEHFDISIIEIDPHGKIILKKIQRVPIL